MQSQHADPRSIWVGVYDINSLLINTQGRLGLYALLNLLQDVGWAHAHSLGHGHQDTANRKAMWVLTRQKTRMTEWPDWGSKITIKTWLRPPESVFANRDYQVFLGEKLIGEATSSFLLLNNETRKPMREDLSKLGFPVRPNERVSLDAEKIQPQTDVTSIAKFLVRNSDIDMNKHVNNTRYAQWVLDAVPFTSHKKFALRDYEINFIAETKEGDEVVIQEANSNATLQTGPAFFQGFRERDQKVVFTVRMHLDSRS